MWRDKTNLLHDEVNLLNSKKVQLTGEVESARTQNAILEETRNELTTQIYLLEKQVDSLKINTQILNDKHDELWVICQEQKTNRDNLDTEVDCLRVKRSACENDIASLTATRDGLLASIEQIHRQIDENTELYYQNAMSAMQDSFDMNAEKAGAEYRQQIEEYEKMYLDTMRELAGSLDGEIAEKKEQLAKTTLELKTLHEALSAAIEERKRADDNNRDFYKLELSEVDKKEIYRLREVVPYLREARPLNKMIWEGYYQKPYKDLVARVVGEGKVSGIYKLTNLKNEKSYIGQAVDISNRWSEHIKRGLGIDTNNQILYAAMREDGPENFSYEIIEVCPRSDLDNKEKYWINYFRTMEYGYNMKVG